ncbi:MAG: hypothetical protein LQ337_005425 [Flavoplaca oasis]|nr:MAG: hypothetical protein LQ337_005425 [Flavoplaca oasis]
MSWDSRRPTNNLANTSTRVNGYRPPPTGPQMPHGLPTSSHHTQDGLHTNGRSNSYGLNIVPLQPLNNHHSPNRLRTRRQLAIEYMRRLRQFDAELVRSAIGFQWRRNVYLNLLRQLALDRRHQDVNEEENHDTSQSGRIESDNDVDIQSIDSEGYDGDDEDDDYDGYEDVVEFLALRDSMAHLQLPSSPPLAQPQSNIHGQRLHLGRGRATSPLDQDDLVYVAGSDRIHVLDRRRLEEAFSGMLRRMTELQTQDFDIR